MPVKHGFTKRNNEHPLYNRWENMNQRTSNPNCRVFKYYGGRGISVCPEWREFLPFYNWATENGFSPELELDRKDGDGNYCPENCRWVDGLTNRRNVAPRKRNKPYNWGIHVSPNGKFVAQVWMNKKNNVIGRFNSEAEAIEARDKFISGLISPKKLRHDAGVYRTESGKFLVHVVRSKKLHRVGTFETHSEAMQKRSEYILSLQGQSV